VFDYIWFIVIILYNTTRLSHLKLTFGAGIPNLCRYVISKGSSGLRICEI